MKVVAHIRSYDREESHYAREKTRDREFLDSTLSVAELWRQFRRKKEEEGTQVSLSYTTYRSIFRQFRLSFRKPYVDTCGMCDAYLMITKYSKDEKEKENAQRLKREHVRKADEHYDSINYDFKKSVKEKKKEEYNWTQPASWVEQ